MSKQEFKKPFLNPQQHINLLLNRGLVISNTAQAEHYLGYVGYYRLSGYLRFFYKNQSNPSHTFIPNTIFSTVIDLYEFDTALRSLLLSAIEKIEVAARAVICNAMCEQFGAHWYTDKNNFKTPFRYDDFIEQVKRETDYAKYGGRKLIFKSYYDKYSKPELPASWMLFEVLSLGTLSRIYEYIKTGHIKNSIADKFNLPHHQVFSSWLQSISFIRNICAHHGMICYRNFHITPLKPISWTIEQQKPFLNQNSINLQIFIIQHLLNAISFNSDLQSKIKKLLHRYPNVSLAKMGFKSELEKEATLYSH